MGLIRIICNICSAEQGEYEDPDSDRGMFCVCKDCVESSKAIRGRWFTERMSRGSWLAGDNCRGRDHQISRDEEE